VLLQSSITETNQSQFSQFSSSDTIPSNIIPSNDSKDLNKDLNKDFSLLVNPNLTEHKRYDPTIPNNYTTLFRARQHYCETMIQEWDQQKNSAKESKRAHFNEPSTLQSLTNIQSSIQSESSNFQEKRISQTSQPVQTPKIGHIHPSRLSAIFPQPNTSSDVPKQEER